MENLLTISKASRRLGVHPSTLRRWEAEGRIKPTRLPSGHRRFDVDAIAKVLLDGSAVKTCTELQDWLQRIIDEGD